MDGKQLKASIIQWAVQGKLLPQNPGDEPGEKLLERIFLAREKELTSQKNNKSKRNQKFLRSRIYRDNGVWYEQIGSSTPETVDDEISFDIPENWVWCRIGDIFYHASGKQQSSSNKAGGTPQKFITTSNLYWGRFVLDKVKVMNFTEYEIRNCSATKGDLLVCEGGAGYGRSAIWDKDYDICLQNHVHRLRPCIKGICEYVYYYIYLLKETNRLASVGTAMPGLSANRLKSIILPLPPLAEQKRIVEKLNQILPLVEEYGSAQKQLDELNASLPKNLKRSILQEAVQGKLVPHLESDGNSEKLVERIVKEKNELDKKIPKKRKDAPCKDISDDEVPFPIPETWRWLRLSSMAVMYTGNSINETEKLAKYTNVEGMEYIGTKDVGFDHKVNYKNGVAIPGKYIQDFKIAPANSVLLCIEGGSAGRKICVIDQDVCFGNKLCCFTTSNECAKYLYYYLQSPLFFDVFRDNKTGIIGGVSVNTLKELLIPIPPIAEQKRIVKKIEELFSSIDSMNLV